MNKSYFSVLRLSDQIRNFSVFLFIVLLKKAFNCKKSYCPVVMSIRKSSITVSINTSLVAYYGQLFQRALTNMQISSGPQHGIPFLLSEAKLAWTASKIALLSLK